MRKFWNFLAILLLAAGFVFLSYPFLQESLYTRKSNQSISDFKQQAEEVRQQGKSEEEQNKPAVLYKNLYSQMQVYNKSIFDEKQSALCDAFSYTTNDFDFQAEGLSDDMVGYVTIPAMELELPLYIGANTDNMAKGATVLNQTSMPIGGNNTNCVIAAHRGYGGAPMFRDIEKLKPGDLVQITNLWETLNYTVEKCIAIDPYDIDKIKIISNQDMVTLVTCHPYAHNYQRYVVYCVREEEGNTEKSISQEKNWADILPDGAAFIPSEDDIRLEQILLIAGLFFIGILILFLLIFQMVKKHKERKQKRNK